MGVFDRLFKKSPEKDDVFAREPQEEKAASARELPDSHGTAVMDPTFRKPMGDPINEDGEKLSVALSVRLRRSTVESLERIAIERDESRTQVARDAIEFYVAHNEPPSVGGEPSFEVYRGKE